MNDRLYINGQQVDLSPSTTIAKTLQVNDIASFESRQANFTRSFDVPKTPTNIKIFDYLGVVGNDSNIPYQKNTCDYYIGNECIIYQGFANVIETTSVYKLNVYDGIIDFYKAIENKTFSEINLSGLTHQKTLSNIIGSWSGSSIYKYIVADYNGKATYSNSKINSDYLIPSAPVKYIWDKIFNKYNFTYSGSVFSTPDFTNLWMTYPKGVEATGDVTIVYDNDKMRFEQFTSTYQGITSLFFKHYTGSYDLLTTIVNNTHFKPAVAGNYKIELAGMASPIGNGNSLSGIRCDIWLAKNSIGLTANNVVPIQLLKANVGGDYNTYFDFSCQSIVNINPNETFCLIVRRNDGKNLRYVQQSTNNPLTFKISKVEGADVSFDTALQDFKIKDFINEIVWRFGLTIFKNKYTNNYEFLTLQERLKNADVADWSKKYIEKTSEKYLYGSYAQNNYLRYTYNDSKNDHKDGLISINNVNLDDAKNIIQSKIYAPEKLKTNYLPISSNVYKLWDKEINDNNDTQEVNHKPLDKRFYFLRSQNQTFSATTIGSEVFSGGSVSITSAPFESFSGLSFTEIASNYYSDISKILNKSKLINAKFFLKADDISNFDFRKIYHVEQLGGQFLINKINNFVDGTITDVELIKIETTPSFYPPIPDLPDADGRQINLTSTTLVYLNPNNYLLTINYTTVGIADSTINLIYDVTSAEPNTGTITKIIPRTNLSSPTLALFQLSTIDNLVYSNESSFVIPN